MENRDDKASPRKIPPLVNLPVWYRPHASESLAGPDQPLAGFVTYVHNPSLLNLVVFDPRGVPRPRTDIVLCQPGEERPTDKPYCEWPQFMTDAMADDQCRRRPTTNVDGQPDDDAELARMIEEEEAQKNANKNRGGKGK